MTTIEVSDELKMRLAALTRETGQSEDALLRLIVQNGLEDVEDYYRALAVSERIARGEETTVSLEEVEQRLGLAD
jgi:RHH-type transcriptional regulator, rel operon repressor / antitoxin RelB